jgi:methylated-DNA-[protein]-cysteine S-methyltransferase
MIQYIIYHSPIGQITISTDGTSISSVHIEGDRYFTHIPDEWKQNQDEPLLQRVQVELDKYFAGLLTEFTIPITPQGTEFQQLVWRALREIPIGTTISYGDLAKRIGRPHAVRAVGTAIGRNPICIIIPCHRVLASNGSLGGYVAGVERKQYLLHLEKQHS